jgi:hypothetical protein
LEVVDEVVMIKRRGSIKCNTTWDCSRSWLNSSKTDVVVGAIAVAPRLGLVVVAYIWFMLGI